MSKLRLVAVDKSNKNDRKMAKTLTKFLNWYIEKNPWIVSEIVHELMMRHQDDGR